MRRFAIGWVVWTMRVPTTYCAISRRDRSVNGCAPIRDIVVSRFCATLWRAHAAFCHHILQTGEGCFREIRATLRKVHNLPIPEKGADPETDPTYDLAAHKTAFLSWLNFLKGNLSSQTAVRVDGAWASQLTLLQGMANFGVPDMILREGRLRGDLAALAGQLGLTSMP